MEKDVNPVVKHKLFWLLLSVFLFLFLLLVDRLILLLPLPSAGMHPPSFHEVRRNLEFSYLFQTNSRGLRYREIPEKKPKNSFRVFVCGDSFTEGWGVEADSTFCSHLERIFSRPGREANFINGGQTGSGPAQYEWVFENAGLDYQPDALLICLYADDLSNPNPINFGRGLVRTLCPGFYSLAKLAKRIYDGKIQKTGPRELAETVRQEAEKRAFSPSQIESWEKSLPEGLAAAADRGEFNGAILSYGLLRPNYWVDALEIGTPTAEARWREMVTILSRVIVEAKRNKLPVAVVFIPSPFQYDSRFHSPNNPWIKTGSMVKREWLTGTSEVESRLENWAEKAAVPFLSLTPVFREGVKTDSNLNFPLDGHWTPAGHRLAAGAIGKWLKKFFLSETVTPGPANPLAGLKSVSFSLY